MSDQDEAARRIAFFRELEREAATASNQDQCEDPGCACHRDGDRPGDGADGVQPEHCHAEAAGRWLPASVPPRPAGARCRGSG